MTFTSTTGNVAHAKVAIARGKQAAITVVWATPATNQDLKEFEEWLVSNNPHLHVALNKRQDGMTRLERFLDMMQFFKN